MSLRDITRQSVLEAIEEFDQVGRNYFLKKYHFGHAKSYWLVYDGRKYDSKAIIGVAHKYARPELGQLRNFSGGTATVQPKLESLGFTVWVDRDELDDITLPGEADSDTFDPLNIKDGRERIARMIANRKGQPAFRATLLNAYGRRCAISDCDVVDVLEAAHICPYQGPDTNKVVNGILLRADIHTLFDLGLIAIDHRSMEVLVHKSIESSEYHKFHGRKLRIPLDSMKSPSRKALKFHFDNSFQ